MSPDKDTYQSKCKWWGLNLPSIDKWNDGSYHCSECGRTTILVNNNRRHKAEFDSA